MKTKSLLILMLLLCGCNASRRQQHSHLLRSSSVEDQSRFMGTATVVPWLGDLTTIKLNPDNNQLGDVFQRSQLGGSVSELFGEVVAAANSDSKTPIVDIAPKSLVENLVVIQRGRQNWYFPKPWLSTHDVSNIVVEDGDQIIGLSLLASVFAPTEDSARTFPIEIQVIGETTEENGPVLLQSIKESRLTALTEQPAAKGKFRLMQTTNTVVVTRTTSNAIHHLVIPVSVDKKSNNWLWSGFKNIISETKTNELAYSLESGDVLRFTRKELLPLIVQ